VICRESPTVRARARKGGREGGRELRMEKGRRRREEEESEEWRILGVFGVRRRPSGKGKEEEVWISTTITQAGIACRLVRGLERGKKNKKKNKSE
jgi:hypothetical protein